MTTTTERLTVRHRNHALTVITDNDDGYLLTWTAGCACGYRHTDRLMSSAIDAVEYHVRKHRPTYTANPLQTVGQYTQEV